MQPQVHPSPAPRLPKPLWREYLETVVGAALLAGFIMVFVARAFTVDGPSMQPTLYDSERLLVDKITYRLRPPQRGDIVVFRYPSNMKQHFIKRVIGIPGDTVLVRNGRVYLNGVALDESYVAEAARYPFGPVVVPEGYYFVMGDNRNNSEDSRDPRVGPVARQLIVGRALWRYWPLHRMSMIKAPPLFQTLQDLSPR